MSAPVLESATLEIARVSKSHGLRGEIRVRLHNLESRAFEHVKKVFFAPEQGEGGWFVVASARSTPRGELLKLEGIDSREAADRWRGARVLVERVELPALEEGEVYLVDLIGAQVYVADSLIGVVEEVLAHPTVDSLLIRMQDGSTAQQPVVEAWIEQIDSKGKSIELVSMEGLIR